MVKTKEILYIIYETRYRIYYSGERKTCVKQRRKKILNFDDIVSALRTELNTNKIFYQGFCQDNIDILEEFERYLEDPLANYGKDSTDLFLNALGNAYKLGIIIFQSNSGQCWIVDQADNISLLKLYILSGHNHYTKTRLSPTGPRFRF